MNKFILHRVLLPCVTIGVVVRAVSLEVGVRADEVLVGTIAVSINRSKG